MASSWIEYQDGIETLQPDEGAMIDEIVASMGRLHGRVFDKHRHAVRDAHAKVHGVLKGTLSVHTDLPETLEQGIFRRGREYPVFARLSSAPGDIHPDEVRSLKGFAVKVFGVEGARLRTSMEQGVTQDFLFVNLPILPFGDVKSYLEMQRKQEEAAQHKSGSRSVIPDIASSASAALKAFGIPNRTLEAIGASAHHILGETFHTMAALRFGRYVAKLSLAPLSDSVRLLTGQAVDASENDSAYRDLVVAFFQRQSATYQVRAQICTDLTLMPVEDAAVEWPEDLSPHLPLGTMTFPVQDAYSPARRVYADEVLSFNPWQGIEAHRPLGSIMRSRIKAYEASTQFRHTQNARTRSEPRDIAEIPD
jgi:catalase